MSTLKVNSIQHPSSSTPAITLDSTGAMTGSLPYPNRNLLYNGAMQVHQRGTSSAGITVGNYYTADRWFMGNNALGTWTQSVENDAPTGSGFRKSLKVLCTTADASPAAGDYLQIQQYLEGQDLQRIAKGTSSAQQLTLSFWVKSNVTGAYIASLTDGDNSRYIASSYTISSSGIWERKVITFAADTTGVFDNDNALSMQLTFWLASGSTYTSGTLQTSWSTTVNANLAPGQLNLGASTNNYWQITGVQLETGSVATPFEFKSFGQELRECQRYYWHHSKNADGLNSVFFHAQIWTNNGQGYIQFPQSMRIAPALTTTGTFGLHSGGVTTQTLSSVSANGTTQESSRIAIAFTYTPSTQGISGQVYAGSSPSVMAWNAEL